VNSLEAFARGQAAAGKELMVFDWHRAAELIAQRKPRVAAAGLRGDWEWTGGDIWRNGEPAPAEQTYVYLASTWAVPEINLDGECIACYVMQSQSPGWDSGTYWPESALAKVQP